jgi:5,5'-dehydrodivanillate O-demethylase
VLSKEENERLTQTSAGTPMGDLLRMYWHPIAAAAQLGENPVIPVRILGEDLTLYKSRSGKLGLIGQRCLHRLVDLKYGFPSEDHDEALVCPYHGWAYDRTGQCVAQPAEREGSNFKDKMRIPAYPVKELAGLIFAYLGPDPAPELPAWEPMVMEGTLRYIEYGSIPCNWVQAQENSSDRYHAEWLHGHFSNTRSSAVESQKMIRSLCLPCDLSNFLPKNISSSRLSMATSGATPIREGTNPKDAGRSAIRSSSRT